MADLSKSCIAGTRKGVVLDLKVGPSKWVEEYLGCFEKKFVSYTRGANTPGGLPTKHWDTQNRTWDDHFKTEAAKVKKAYTGK